MSKESDVDKLVKVIRLSRNITTNYQMIQGCNKDSVDDIRIKDKLIKEIIEYHKQLKEIEF